MTALALFLLGLPAAFIANRLILSLSSPFDDDDDEEPNDTQLPWQRGAWPGRIRALTVATLPALMALAGWRFDLGPAIAVSIVLGALLICTATDLIRYRVPNAVTYPCTLFALLAAILLPGGSIVGALAAALLGGGVFLILAILTHGGLGLGDVKLAMLIGAALGLPAAYQALAIGVIVGGLVIALLFIGGVVGRKQGVPYAPFLALAAVAVVLSRGAAFAPL